MSGHTHNFAASLMCYLTSETWISFYGWENRSLKSLSPHLKVYSSSRAGMTLTAGPNSKVCVAQHKAIYPMPPLE